MRISRINNINNSIGHVNFAMANKKAVKSDAATNNKKISSSPYATAPLSVVPFTAINEPLSVDEINDKMRVAAVDILDNDIKLKEGQRVAVTADKTYIPFLTVFAEEAYKKGASDVDITLVEKDLDDLYSKYCKEPDYDFKKKIIEYNKDKGAAFINFDSNNNPYKLSGLSNTETIFIQKIYGTKVPASLHKKVSEVIEPQEVIDYILNLQKGQPLLIYAERELEPTILKLAEYAYKNGSGPIEVKYYEFGLPFYKAKLKYSKDEYLKEFPSYIIDQMKERADRNQASLTMYSFDPEAYDDIDPDKMSKREKAYGDFLRASGENNLQSSAQWNFLYVPTSMSAKAAYIEAKNPIEALDMAVKDAKKFNRPREVKTHITNLSLFQDKLNSLNLDRIHFYSVDPMTKEPDGKTDLYVGLSDISRFSTAKMKTPDGVEFVSNTPTEEVFTAPDKTRTEGHVTVSMPTMVLGRIVEGAKFEFKNGRAIDIKATKNEKLLQYYLRKHRGGLMLGEVSLVGDSPILDANRVFNSILLDENATCHIALGNSYASCADGAEDITDYTEQNRYLKEHNFNISSIHTDFMIGGPNVVAEGITKDGKVIPLVKDCKFQI